MTQRQKHILIVEDEDIIRSSLRKLLERHDYVVSEAVSVKSAWECFNLNNFDLIISDLRLPGCSGSEFINSTGSVPVLIMTSYANLRSAVEIMRQGAADYIPKPFDHDEMLNAVKRITHKHKSKKPTQQGAEADQLLLGNSREILKILSTIHRVAPTSAPILINGETGTGKRTIAKTIHKKSTFADQPFVTINCASVSQSQLCEQLESHPAATLFLNHVGELPIALQPIVLKVLQHHHYRCIASTEQDLKALSETNQFRKDLFYSLNVINIQVAALRERRSDIPCLTQYFVDQYCLELGRNIELSAQATQALSDYSWPGNVQELQNTLYQSALLFEEGKPINVQMLGLQELLDNGMGDTVDESEKAPFNEAATGLSLEDYFTCFVLQHQENMSETALARKLGISRKSLWERRNKLGISRKKTH